MIGGFFIDRPIFAWVIALGIALGGALALTQLPVAQYPDVAPPRVTVSATYPGASAETLENSVTQVLEQQLKGLNGLLYFSSTSGSDGYSEIALTFEQDVDPDKAQVQVQAKLQQAISRLPFEVQRQGLEVTKALPAPLLIVALWDPTDRRSHIDIADYLVSAFQDPISRVDGVGYTQVFGAQYAMRVWLDPYKLASYKLMPSDVDSAIRAQNTQVAAGAIGAQPAPAGQQLNATVTSQSRLQTPKEFCAIILKTQKDGSQVRLCDVARVELGSENYGEVTQINGHPASGMAITLAPRANALATARAVKSKVAELQRQLPEGLLVRYSRDSTAFVERSIREVAMTLAEAIVLVMFVMYVFLKSWRSTLIPAIAVPVVLAGTVAVLAWLGYSINTLTLFGMVLAIGLLVDDAIVVVENVERLMREHRLSPREATLRSVKEINSTLVAIALVLAAVFLPMAFFGGSTGIIYRQFSVTIVASMLLSALVALTLSPALCTSLLRSQGPSAQPPGRLARQLMRVPAAYVGLVHKVIMRPLRAIGLYLLVLVALVALMHKLPTGFLPLEDRGETIVQFMLPVGATQVRTLAVAETIERYFFEKERANIHSIFTVAGFSFSGAGQNAGLAFIQLKPWEERHGATNAAEAINARATSALAALRDAQVFAITPPAIEGLGETNGFTYQLLDTSGVGRASLTEAREKLLELASKDERLMNVRYNGFDDTPQLRIDIDQAKVGALGLALDDVNATLTAAWGGSYVNDFVDRGRVKRVYQQGDAEFRSAPEDLRTWFVRSSSGEMTPFSAFASTRWVKGPQTLSRFNGSPSYELQGEAAPGESSGTALRAIELLTQRVSRDISGAWSSLSYQELLSSGQAPGLYAISTLVVFMCLAALYESWSIPLSVLLVIPLGAIGTVVAAHLRGLENDVFFQIALITTIGLSAKNAILMVEFAEIAERSGQSPVEAAMSAAKARLRPIMMTSLAFMAGVLPLAVATGAGAASRIAIGTEVVGGVLTAAVLACLFVPMFFVVVRQLGAKLSKSLGSGSTSVDR